MGSGDSQEEEREIPEAGGDLPARFLGVKPPEGCGELL